MSLQLKAQENPFDFEEQIFNQMDEDDLDFDL